MKHDANTRIHCMNLIMEAIDNEVNAAWLKLTNEIAADNKELCMGTQSMFSYQQTYFPIKGAERFKVSFLRKNVKPLHEDLMEEFEGLYKIFVKDYPLFRGKFKNLLGKVCREAVSIDCFNSVLPSSIMRPINTQEVSYAPLRSATGWRDDEHVAQFIQNHKAIIDKAVYFASIGKLI